MCLMTIEALLIVLSRNPSFNLVLTFAPLLSLYFSTDRNIVKKISLWKINHYMERENSTVCIQDLDNL